MSFTHGTVVDTEYAPMVAISAVNIGGGPNQAGTEIRFFDGLDNEMFAGSYFVPGTGGNTATYNTWDRLFFSGITGIQKLEINLRGSGAIDNLSYNVSIVPVPAAVWLFGTALLGFIGLSRRTSV